MKWSKFNMCRKSSNGNYVLFNYATDNALVFLPELYSIIKNVHDVEELSSIHPELYKTLYEKNFIVDDDFDEILAVKNNICKKLTAHDKFHLTINPTMDCNLRCWYCYEKHTEKGYMTAEIQNAIIQFVTRLMANSELKILDLGFFGGEPLMKANQIVLPLLKRINEICITHGKKLDLHFTSNGVLMSKKFIESLLLITNSADFQIAIDGGQSVHDKTKFMHNHKGTYNIVLQNIDYGMYKGFLFNIRCNYTDENIESFDKLIEDICKLPHINKNLIRFSLQRVWQSTWSKELDKKVDALGKRILENGMKANIATKYVPDFCYADYKDSLVINYNGNVYKCTARNFNDENRIGTLCSNGLINFDPQKAEFYSKMFFFSDCDTCSLLPLCRICVQARFDNRKNKNCFKNISEEDKQRQINNYLEAHCNAFL